MKNLTPRHLLVLASLAPLAAFAPAQQLVTFTNGTVANAVDVNGNFANLNNRLTPFTDLLGVQNGNLGIGTTSPTRLLTLSGSNPIIHFADTDNLNGFHWEVQANAFNDDHFGIVHYTPTADLGSSVLVSPAGTVGIGTLPTSTKLEVNGDAHMRTLNLDSNAFVRGFVNVGDLGSWQWRLVNTGGTGANNYLYIDEFGNRRHFAIQSGGNNPDQGGFLGLGLNPQEGQPLNATHRITLPNDASLNKGRAIAVQWATHSSRDYKTNIATIADPVQKLMRLRGVTFDWKAELCSSGKSVADVGFIAEEAAEVFPAAATYDSKGKVLGLDYSRLLPVTIEVVKQQQRRIEELEAQLARFSDLEARLAALEAAAPTSR